jgi:hypothetical protein
MVLGNRCSIHLSYRPRGLFYRIQQNVWNWACRATFRISFRRGGCHPAELSDGFRFAAVDDGNNILDVGTCVRRKQPVSDSS